MFVFIMLSNPAFSVAANQIESFFQYFYNTINKKRVKYLIFLATRLYTYPLFCFFFIVL